MVMIREDVGFSSGGDICAAWLYPAASLRRSGSLPLTIGCKPSGTTPAVAFRAVLPEAGTHFELGVTL